MDLEAPSTACIHWSRGDRRTLSVQSPRIFVESWVDRCNRDGRISLCGLPFPGSQTLYIAYAAGDPGATGALPNPDRFVPATTSSGRLVWLGNYQQSGILRSLFLLAGLLCAGCHTCGQYPDLYIPPNAAPYTLHPPSPPRPHRCCAGNHRHLPDLSPLVTHLFKPY